MPKTPQAANHREDPAYVRELLDRIKARHGLSIAKVAARVGVSERHLYQLLAGFERKRIKRKTIDIPRAISYPLQFTLEALADAAADE